MWDFHGNRNPNLLGPGMFVEGGLNTNYTVLSNLFGSFDFNRGTN